MYILAQKCVTLSLHETLNCFCFFLLFCCGFRGVNEYEPAHFMTINIAIGQLMEIEKEKKKNSFVMLFVFLVLIFFCCCLFCLFEHFCFVLFFALYIQFVVVIENV